MMDYKDYSDMQARVSELMPKTKQVTDGVEMGIIMEDFLNSMDDKRLEDFLNYMTSFAHRTLQQKYFGLLLDSVKMFASMEYYDDRNRVSVEKAQKIQEFMENNGIPMRVPLI